MKFKENKEAQETVADVGLIIEEVIDAVEDPKEEEKDSCPDKDKIVEIISSLGEVITKASELITTLSKYV